MDGLQGAVLRVKLRYLDSWNQCRRAHAAQYDAALEGLPGIILPVQSVCVRHVHHIYAIRVSRRDEIIEFLADQGIATGIHYPVPVHLQAAYRDLGYERGAFPISERCADEFLSLPMYPELTAGQLEMVIRGVKQAVASCKEA